MNRLALFLLLPALLSGAESWPQWRGPAANTSPASTTGPGLCQGFGLAAGSLEAAAYLLLNVKACHL